MTYEDEEFRESEEYKKIIRKLGFGGDYKEED